VPIRSLRIIELTFEEWEALRLKHMEGLDQIGAAKKMKTSQSTIQRILASAHKKVGQAVVRGCAIKISRQ